MKHRRVFEKRFPGARWTLVYDQREGIERVAVDELQREVQEFLPYVLETVAARDIDPREKENLILAGTATRHPFIGKLARNGRIAIPSEPDAYTIACVENPWREKQKILTVNPLRTPR